MLHEDCRGQGEDGADGLGWRRGMSLRRWKEITNGLRGMRVGQKGVSGDFSFLEEGNDSRWGSMKFEEL